MKEARSFLNLSSIDSKVGFEIDDFYDHEYDEYDGDDFDEFEFVLRHEYPSSEYTEDTTPHIDYNDFRNSRPVHSIRAG